MHSWLTQFLLYALLLRSFIDVFSLLNTVSIYCTVTGGSTRRAELPKHSHEGAVQDAGPERVRRTQSAYLRRGVLPRAHALSADDRLENSLRLHGH